MVFKAGFPQDWYSKMGFHGDLIILNGIQLAKTILVELIINHSDGFTDKYIYMYIYIHMLSLGVLSSIQLENCVNLRQL